MQFQDLGSPTRFLEANSSNFQSPDWLKEYEAWIRSEGQPISDAVDRSGTPWLRMFDTGGGRVDQILYPPDYWRLLRTGYRAGLLWRIKEENSLASSILGIYVTSFFDPGLACPYTVSLGTLLPLLKYGNTELQQRFLPMLMRKDDRVWQGATWMTEIKGGCDLGTNVETVARHDGDRWLLTGDKYFASNAGAELAVVAARPKGAPAGIRGLALYLVPRYRQDGGLNYFIRRLKDKIATRSVPTGEIELRNSEAWLLGSDAEAQSGKGIYLMLEVLNASRVANTFGSVALGQRSMADALSFAQNRIVFGKPLIQQPLMGRQFQERLRQLRAAGKLAWKSLELLNEVWQQKPPYSDQFHLFRLITHLAKYWTAELAVQTAKWCMEVHGGLGTLQEFRVERWLREAMILAIWEGPAHRQMLDALEVMERKRSHQLLFALLADAVPKSDLEDMRDRVERHLSLPCEEKEAGAEALIADFARFTAEALLRNEN